MKNHTTSDDSATLKAIETRYAGCRFRSRLEARWAVFFDALSMKWQYEAQGFRLSDGTQYLPDFEVFLGSRKTPSYLEIKPTRPDLIDPKGLAKWEKFAGVDEPDGRGADTYLLIGGIPDPATVDVSGPQGLGEWYDDGIVVCGDSGYAWCVCPWCGRPGIQFAARGARVCGYKEHFATEDEAAAKRPPYALYWPSRVDDKCYTGSDPRILAAYAAARAERFGT